MNEHKHREEDEAMGKEITAEFGEGWLPPGPTMQITAPVAWPGDKVLFSNYRAAVHNNPQIGKVIHVDTQWGGPGKYIHRYTIVPAKKNYQIRATEVTLIQ